MEKRSTIALTLIVFILILVVGAQIYFEMVNLFTLFLYLLSIGICIFIIRNFFKWNSKKIKTVERKDVIIISSLIVLQLGLLWYFSGFPSHYHYDDFIHAHSSHTLPSLSEIDWFRGYPLWGFVAGYPILFYILQKPFLVILGPSVAAVKISTWPYTVLIVIYTYLLAKEIFTRRFWAVIASLFLIFLAPHLFIASLGQHLTSSAAFSTASIYYFIRLLKTNSKTDSVLCGIFASLGYLTNSASYIIAPLLIAFTVIESLWTRSVKPLRQMIPALIIFLVVLAPFIVYAQTKDNYFMHRISAVNLFWGDWSHLKGNVHGFKGMLFILKDQFSINFKSLYTPGIGGAGGYSFAYQAMLDMLTFIIFVFGCFLCIFQGTLYKKRTLLYVFIALFTAFFFGMVLTVPQAAFHRIFVIFPFIAIAMITGISSISEKVPNKFGKLALPIALLVVFVATNLQIAYGMVKFGADEYDSIHMARFLNAYYPEGTYVYISGFYGYHLERELYIRTHNKYKLWTEGLDTMLPKIIENPGIVILLHPSTADIKMLQKEFPDGRAVTTLYRKRLSSHVIFVPNI